jgi:hypothetical protein
MADNNIVLQMASYVRPEIKESTYKEWVLNGDNNEFYQYIIDRYNGSPTNSAILDSYTRMTYGLGLNIDIPLFSKNEVRKIVKDFCLFGEASFELMYQKNKPVKAIHVPKQMVAPEKADDKGNITGYYYCYDWNKITTYEPKRFDAFKYGKGANRSEIVVIKDYQVGQFYFSNPAYLSAMPYAELEEEIANFFINHVKNKFMVSTIINVNNGIPESEEERKQIARKYQGNTTGTNNAGVVIVSFNDNKENATTIEQVQINDAYQQYDFLSKEARYQICVAHKANASIIGVEKSTGFSSNAEEIQTAFNETMLNVIQPMQEVILDVFQEVVTLAGINETLSFIPLREAKADEAQSGQEVAMSKIEINPVADALIELGEVIDEEEWECIDELKMNGEPQLTETALHLAKVPSSFPNATSEQDTSLFKIRYSYAGEKTGEREFCNKMLNANKVYRKEDIELAGTKVVNAGFGPNGIDTYNIWLYHGGVNCKHFWMRKIYLRRNNTTLSVNEARKMILALDPSERKNAQWVTNEKEVATPTFDQPNRGALPK